MKKLSAVAAFVVIGCGIIIAAIRVASLVGGEPQARTAHMLAVTKTYRSGLAITADTGAAASAVQFVR